MAPVVGTPARRTALAIVAAAAFGLGGLGAGPASAGTDPPSSTEVYPNGTTIPPTFLPVTPGWTTGRRFALPAGATAAQTQIGYAAGGVATAGYLAAGVLHVGTITPGRGWDEQFSVAASAFRLSVAADGAAVLGFAQASASGGGATAYLASYRAAGSTTWGGTVTIATDPAGAGAPQLAAATSPGGAGAIAVAHADPALSPAGDRIDVVTATAGGMWSAPSRLAADAAGDAAARPVLAFDAAGDLTAAYVLTTTGGDELDAQSLAGGGAWSARQTVATAPGPAVPKLSVDAGGDGLLAFASGSDTEASRRTGPVGTWSAPATAAPGAGVPLDGGVAPDGSAYVLVASGGCVAAVRAAAGQPFGSPVCASSGGLAAPFAGAVAFTGDDARLAWSAARGSQRVVEGASWPAASPAPTGAVDLDPAAAGLALTQLVPDGDGSTAAFWADAGGSVRAAAYDAGGPLLVRAVVPARTIALQTFVLSVTATDLWSGLGTPPVWSFGDGEYVEGAQVAHAYADPGSYTIGVTAQDGLGNTTTASFPIAVGLAIPRIGAVRSRPARWTVRRGTVLRFWCSEDASVQLTFVRMLSHQRTAPAGGLALPGHEGMNLLGFHGRLAYAALAPGRYTVLATATNVSGTSPRSVGGFTIVTRR